MQAKAREPADGGVQDRAPWCFPSHSPDDTRSAGRALGGIVAPEGVVLRLAGELGVGKTAFAQGLASAWGIDPGLVTSPTFTLVNEYPLADGGLFAHVDFYRLESEHELEGIGFYDLLEPGVRLVVEWGDRFPGGFPADVLDVATPTGPCT